MGLNKPSLLYPILSPVILLTAKASQQNKLDGLETGADDYLIKPFDEKELLVRIKNLIVIREKLQKKYQQGAWLKPSNINITSVQQKFIEDIKEIIEKNIDNSQFSVDNLGEEIAMSRSQVHRKLKAITDQSATKFIRNYRLHRAAELIKQEGGNITEIAYQVGFSSQTYFSTRFQELFKCSPTEYRNNSS
jgi:AraC-like DNA-binding protein